MRNALLLYGVVLALAGGAALWAFTPDDWFLMGFRETDIAAATRALEAGEPPLTGVRVEDGRREIYAVGLLDDQGIYVVAPTVSRWLGLDTPRDAIKLLWIVLSMVPVLMAPLLWTRLFGHVAAGVVAPLVLLAGIRTIGLTDIYWIVPWAILTLLPPVLLIARRRPRRWLAWLALVVLAASFASAIRSNAGLPVAIAAAAVAVTAAGGWRTRLVGVGVVVAAYLVVSPLLLSAVREHRDSTVGAELSQGSGAGHSFWHPAYIGLGYLPNRRGTRWRDDFAYAAVRRDSPSVDCVSAEYDATLRRLTLGVVEEQPAFVAGTIGRKLVVVVRDSRRYLLVLAILLPAALWLGGARREKLRLLLLLAPALAITLAPPLLAVPARAYELGLFGLWVLLATLSVAWLATVLAASGGAWRARLRELPIRRTAVTTVASIAALALCTSWGNGIQATADEWFAAAPPPMELPGGQPLCSIAPPLST